MADEVNNEEEENNTFGSFNNKYVRGGIAAVIAAYAAKKDPYLLEGFTEKMDEYEKADRARRNKFIETATAAGAKEIARNKLRRLERYQSAEPDIKRAVALGMNPYLAGKAYQTGDLKTYLKQKAKNPTLNLDSLYEVEKQYKGQIAGFSTEDILESLAGPTAKLENLMDGVKAPKSQSFLRNFIRGGEEDTSAIDEINKNIDLQQPSKDSTTKAVDFSQVRLSDRGTQFLESVGLTKGPTYGQSKTEIASYVSETLGLKGLGGKSPVSIGAGEFMFQSDSVKNNKIAGDIVAKLLEEVESMVNNVNHRAYNNRRLALDIVRDKYQKVTDEGITININAVNFNEKKKIMPDNWTPTTPTKKEIDEVERNTEASNIIKDFLKRKQDIIDDRGLTTTARNEANIMNKARHRKLIENLMKLTPPKATQADLDQIK